MRHVPTTRVRAIMVGLAAVGLAMVVAPTALAGPPEKFDNTVTGDVFVTDCGTFEVWDDYVIHIRGIDSYDRDGDLIRTVVHYWGVDRFYSPETGKSVSGSFAQGATVAWEKGIDWTLYQAVQATHGITFRLNVPGAGVVFHDVGTVEYHLATGDILFLAGPKDYYEGDFTGLCAALA